VHTLEVYLRSPAQQSPSLFKSSNSTNGMTQAIQRPYLLFIKRVRRMTTCSVWINAIVPHFIRILTQERLKIAATIQVVVQDSLLQRFLIELDCRGKISDAWESPNGLHAHVGLLLRLRTSESQHNKGQIRSITQTG
jgi:hypothetical protein